MSLLRTIEEAWGWAGIKPAEIVDQNAFGNVLVKTSENCFWRICPEELSATLLAQSAKEFEQVCSTRDFMKDWDVAPLVEIAKAKLGSPGEGRCYCLKIPGVLGGKYDESNLATISLSELLSVSGDLARQIKDLPNGTSVKLTVTE